MTDFMAIIQADAPDWSDAACRGMNPEAFFPARGGSASARHMKAICDECPIKVDCLDYALANGEKDGIWGGLSGRERRTLRRSMGIRGQRLKPIHHGTPRGYAMERRRGLVTCDACRTAHAQSRNAA